MTTIKMKSERGLVDIELVEGCGDNKRGISLRVDGICVAHFTDFADILKLDIYPSSAHIAGVHWVDVYEKGRNDFRCIKTF